MDNFSEAQKCETPAGTGAIYRSVKPKSTAILCHEIRRTLQQSCLEACDRAGVAYRDVPSDGRIHTANIEGDPRGKGDARIKLFADGEGGIVWNLKTGETLTFFVSDPRKFSAGERQQYAALAEARRREYLAAEAERHKVKAVEFCEWAASSTDPERHKYTDTKQLPGHGLRQLGGLLIAPLFDDCGAVWGGQTINQDGQKRFFTGAKKQGLFCPIGWQVGDTLPELLLAEGWATACAAHLMFQLPAAAAMDAGNLLPAAKTIRKRYPAVKLISASDWDGFGGGIGFTAACEAAHAVGNAKVIKPDCLDDAHCDFADIWLQLRGSK